MVVEQAIVPVEVPVDKDGFLLDASGNRVLIAPELYTLEHFEAMMAEDYRSFMAEMMQDPTVLGGELFKKVFTEDFAIHPYVDNYHLFFIYVDRATTTGRKSDETGIVCGLRENTTGMRLITHDLTGKIPIERALLKINTIVKEFRDMYEHITIALIIEKQGGGDDFYSNIINRVDFGNDHTYNYIRDICAPIMIHATGEKEKRIEDRLEAPIKNGRIRFLSTLQNSILVRQILDFPNCDKLDAIDALAMGDHVIMETYPIVDKEYVKSMIEAYTKYETKQLDDKRQESKVKEQYNPEYSKRRNVIDSF